MAEVSQHEPGMFNWVDLMTTDVESAREFYSQLLGCETVDNPVSDDFVYTLFSRNGKNIAGMSPMMPDMLEQGVPPHWNSYVAVENVEEAAAKAAGLGATVIMPPMDVMEFGRMTSILDPTGAVLNLWEAKAHIGADLIGEPGAFCWAELYTHDTGQRAASTAACSGGRRRRSRAQAVCRTPCSRAEERPQGACSPSSRYGARCPRTGRSISGWRTWTRRWSR